MSNFALAKTSYYDFIYIIDSKDIHAYSRVITIGAFSFSVLLSIVLSLFTKFHLKLILSNSTTIESMDKKTPHRTGNYNKGVNRN